MENNLSIQLQPHKSIPVYILLITILPCTGNDFLQKESYILLLFIIIYVICL